MTEHTPAPWTAQLHHARRDGGRTSAMITAAGIVPLAAVVLGVEGCSQDEGRANARLIAASPTMYDYIVKRAAEGDADAARIIANI